MLSYMSFVHEGLKSPVSPFTDGKKLAHGCVNKLKQLKDPEQFPPRLLLLLASPAYLDSIKAEQLLKGVTQVFEHAGYPIYDEKDISHDDNDGHRLELLGCSVGAVFFDKRVWREGALLVCLASRLLEVAVEVNPDLSRGPEETVRNLLTKLQMLTNTGKPIHSFANRTIFALFPGFSDGRYLAPQLHESLRHQLGGRVPIFGGVATAADPHRVRPGILFANQKVYRNALVAANVVCGTPFGISLTRGLQENDGHRLNVAELDPEDACVIRRFKEGSAREVMKKLTAATPVPLLASMALDRDPTVDQPALEGKTLRLTRETREGERLYPMIPQPEKMQADFRAGVKESMERAYLLNPIGALGFRCTGLLRYSEEIGLDIEHGIAQIEHDLSLRNGTHEKPFVGGFVDGEAGADKNGKPVLGNWGDATLVLGDELRFRTPVYRGFEKLADFAAMRAPESQKDWLNELTKLVYEIGYPGALLSFCVREQERITIVARSASGSRYARVLAKVEPCPLEGDDVLARVARTKQWHLVLDSREEPSGSMRAASAEGVVSQYVAPLKGDDGQVRAVLQIDLGDISYDTDLYESEKLVLEALCKIVSSGLNRSLEAEESRIIRCLDQAMSDCLKEETIKQGLQKYHEQGLAAFGLKEGHIRIAHEDTYKLALVAGVGDYYPEWRQTRLKIDFAERAPTAQAFRSEKVVIVNDPANNRSHQEMFKLWAHKEVQQQKLSQVGSYANIPFKSELGERGIVTLLASEPWFFTWSHENALKALGRRIGFLLETLRRKERESFLLGVSPQFSRIRDLDNFGPAIANGLERFAESAKAEIASLYVWDVDRKWYVLRAQYGWANPRWTNAAYYMEDEIWTGSAALAGTPRHIPDLYKYYEPSGDDTPRYTEDAFGQQLTPSSNMEAICLLLRLGNDHNLGVLTLYRHIEPGEESGFITTDTELLQQGADNFSSLIGVLQAKAVRSWRERERARRQEVYDATLLARGEEKFESDVTRQMLLSYRAVKAAFYKVESLGAKPKLEFRKGFRRYPKTDEVKSLTVSPDDAELALVIKAAESNRRNEKVVMTERVQLGDGQSRDPLRVAQAGLVRRACVPLVSEKQLRGILDLQWSFDRRRRDDPDYYHGEGHLRMVGEVIGSAYGRMLTKNRAELLRAEGEEKLQLGEEKLQQSEDRTRDGVQATTAYVLHHHHELRRIIQDMQTQLRLLKELRADLPEEEGHLLASLSKSIDEGTGLLKQMIQIGRKMVKPAYKLLPVRDTIQSALEKSMAHYAPHEYEIVMPDVPRDYLIKADPSLMDIALGNLLDNCFKFMSDKKNKRRLTIEVVPDGRELTLTLRDTGVGMTREKKKLILEEFYSVDGRVSVGVMISRLILKLHGGTLDYNSAVGKGTDTIIVLPIDHMEESV